MGTSWRQVGHSSWPHAAQYMLPGTLWVTFRMQICSPLSSSEEMDAQTSQPITQFAPIFQTESQTAHSQTCGSELRYGLPG